MSGKAGRSGRPVSPRAKRIAIQIRVTPLEEADLMAIVAHRSREAGGVEVSGPAVIRALIEREARALEAGAAKS